MRIKVADYITTSIQARGVTHVFELIGGMITFLVDSFAEKTNVKIVSMHHEQGAGFAAEGFARISGVPGVALATSGPGATNLLTAIGSCYFDSTPAVFITGQVNRHEQKGDRAVRQLGFQETDIVAMAKPITKAAWLINDPNDIPAKLDAAFALALDGRPGPVLLDIPMDVQRYEIDMPCRAQNLTSTASSVRSGDVTEFLNEIRVALASAKRPLILAGGGVRSSRSTELFRSLVPELGIPVVYSLMGVDCLPSSSPFRVGMIGSYGNRWANIAISECDLLLVAGSRLDVRQTGADTASFKGDRPIYHVDCEPGETNNRVTDCRTLHVDLNAFLTELSQRNLPSQNWSSWLTEISECRAKWPDTAELKDYPGINPNQFLKTLSQSGELVASYVVDVGQHQMWAAQSLHLYPHQRFLTSGGMGAMGFALPAAIGACFACERKPIVMIAGDGGFQLNIQELQTVVRNQLPILMVVLNNGCHGMVRQFQESYFKQRYHSTSWGYSAPSFSAIASSYGINSQKIGADNLSTVAIERLHKLELPALVEVQIDGTTNAYPKMAFGRPISQMEPLATPLEMEGT